MHHSLARSEAEVRITYRHTFHLVNIMLPACLSYIIYVIMISILYKHVIQFYTVILSFHDRHARHIVYSHFSRNRVKHLVGFLHTTNDCEKALGSATGW